MNRSNFGAVRLPLLGAAVLASFAVSLSAQVVEKGRTYADLVATHPCNSGSSGRLARITDAQSSSSIGGGGGSTQVWAVCNGVDTWTLTAIGGGGGVSGLSTADGGTALSDNAIVRGDGTTGVQGSTVTVADSTGNLQWEGTTADAFEGNFTFADPTADWTWAWGAAGDLVGAGSLSVDNLKLDGNTISSTDTNGDVTVDPNGSGRIKFTGAVTDLFLVNQSGTLGLSDGTIPSAFSSGAQSWLDSSSNRVGIFYSGHFSVASDHRIGFSNSTTEANGVDTSMVRSAAGIVGFTNATTGGGAIHLTPMASPPRTCDATAEGDLYYDTSHALCVCDASAWGKVFGAGSCA